MDICDNMLICFLFIFQTGVSGRRFGIRKVREYVGSGTR